jgi:glycosyltransferase involved in cell wall biosynthesis
VRTLLIVDPGVPRLPEEEQRRLEAADECPRATYFDDTLGAVTLDLRSVRGPRSLLYRLLPDPVALALEAFRRRREFDCVVSWYDRGALAYTFLQAVTRSRSPHVAMMTWLSRPKRIALRLLQSRIDRIVLWSKVQRELSTAFFGIEPSKLVSIGHFVDEEFWRPMDAPVLDWICAAGSSQRDYGTLLEAMDGLPVTCRIATLAQVMDLKTVDLAMTQRSLASREIPANVILGGASEKEMREIYARSRFVVLPLLPSFRDSGITVAGEAMAMGKAIICSRTYGMIDTVEHGVNGILVPPGDASALRAAILDLWEHPEKAQRMGREGRRLAESVYSLARFAAGVRTVIDEVLAEQQDSSVTAAVGQRSA